MHVKDMMKIAIFHRIVCLEKCVSRTNEGIKEKINSDKLKFELYKELF